MKTLPFDPATYLDTEAAIDACLADAGQDGPEAVARATEVAARARSMPRGADAPPTRKAC